MTSSDVSSTESPLSSSSSTDSSPFFHLVLFPLALLDLTVHILLFIYTMAFQALLYAIYIGLFIVCIATGQYHKLEKPGEAPAMRSDLRMLKKKQRLQRKMIRSRKTKKNVEAQDDSAYFTDMEVY